jgi:hypothetical protein
MAIAPSNSEVPFKEAPMRQNHTPGDMIVRFPRPRMLYVARARVGFQPGFAEISRA